MKQIHCPHFVRMSGTQYYCMKGNFPVDCYKCNCPDKKEVEVTTTTASAFEHTPIQKKLMEISKPRSEEAIKRVEERRKKRKEHYKQGYKDAIDKACEWLKSGGYFVNNSETEKDFRKAMEE